MKYTLKEKVENCDLKPNPYIIDFIDNGRFPFSKHNIIGYEPGLLCGEEFSRCIEILNNKINTNDYEVRELLFLWYEITQKITTQEYPFRERLQEIASNTIREIFDIPLNIDLESNIESAISLSTNNHKSSTKISEERKLEIQDEINKRIFLTNLVHGSAIHIWKSAYYIIDKEIESINPELMQLYDSYSALTSYLLWTFDPEQMITLIENNLQTNQGFEKLDIENNKISAQAINLPVLFHELTKGVLDFLISKGIPQDYTEDELMYYYSEADKYEDEMWHYYIGPSLWIKLIDALEVSTQELPEKISIIAQMTFEQQTDLFIPIIDDDKEKIKNKLKLYGLK